MGVVKIALQKSRVDNRRKRYRSSNGKAMAQNENSPMAADLVDDYEFTEVGCELGLVDQQLCSIPYELYNLPDLREILSLDSWNSCLTDEERFSLSAFLPDMDEETFCLTMKELLSGTDIYFGNPVETFFKRLQGGFYPPEVAVLREGLQFLQLRKYYHSLKSYHDNMTQMFIKMRRAWNHCDRSADIKERIDIWKTRIKCKSNYLLDLNTVPEDGCLFSENVKSHAVMSRSSKKMKPGDSTRPNSRAKGVLKLKSSGNGSFEKRHPRIDFSDLSEKRRSQKGVLKKVVPKVQPSPLLNSQIFQDRKLLSLPASLYFGGVDSHCELPFLRQNVGVSEVHTNLNMQQSSSRVLSLHDSSIRTGRHSEGSIRKVNPSFDDITNLRGYKPFGSVIGTSPYGEPESAINSMFTRRYNSSLEREQRIEAMKEEPIIVYKRTPTLVSRTSSNFIGKREKPFSSGQMKNCQININRKPEKHFAKPSFSEAFKDEHVLPLTYKRRKTQIKLNSFDFDKPLFTGIDLNSESPKDLNQPSGESTKPLKIKFSVWEDVEMKEDH